MSVNIILSLLTMSSLPAWCGSCAYGLLARTVIWVNNWQKGIVYPTPYPQMLTKKYHRWSNHHGAESSAILLVERSAVKLLILIKILIRKNKLCGPEKSQCFTTLVALFQIRFRSLFFDVEKGRQCSEVTTIPWNLL